MDIRKVPIRGKITRRDGSANEIVSHARKLDTTNGPVSSTTPSISTKVRRHYSCLRPKKTTTRFRRAFHFFSIGTIFVFVVAASIGGYFTWKIHSVGRNILIENSSESSWLSDLRSVITPLVSSHRVILRGEREGRINVLLLGRAGLGRAGTNLTDTIMVASIDVANKRAALLSLPRDLYAPISGSSSWTKINSLLQYGIVRDQGTSYIIDAAESITGLPIHYYAILDFSGFEKIIDDIGGVQVTVERDIHDVRYPGPNYSYETFSISKGTHRLDGATALKYVRQRHGDPEGDFGRAKRQQQVMQAFRDRFFSFGTLLNVFAINRMLTTLGNHVETNATLEEIEGFVLLGRSIDTHDITSSVVDAWKPDSLLRVSHIMVGDVRAFILVPRSGNFSEIRELAKHIFDIDRIAARRKRVSEESASVHLIHDRTDTRSVENIKKFLLEKIGIRSVSVERRTSPTCEQTSVTDLTEKHKPYTFEELIDRLSATPASPDQSQERDILDQRKSLHFIVCLGRDTEKRFDYDYDTTEDYLKANPEQSELLFEGSDYL